MRGLSEVVCEGYRRRRHSAALRNEQKAPPEDECERGMERIAQIRIKAAVTRAPRRQLGEDTRTQECDDAAGGPNAHHQDAAVNVTRDDRWIHEDARTDDAAHHDEGGISDAKLAQKLRH